MSGSQTHALINVLASREEAAGAQEQYHMQVQSMEQVNALKIMIAAHGGPPVRIFPQSTDIFI